MGWYFNWKARHKGDEASSVHWEGSSSKGTKTAGNKGTSKGGTKNRDTETCSDSNGAETSRIKYDTVTIYGSGWLFYKQKTNNGQLTIDIFRIQSAGQSPLQTNKHVANVNATLLLYHYLAI